ncbi:MAG: carbohydrate kinase family protein [Anaerolineales bacterium]|nr:carbohydrate kinase family protein [Anaerolineales bacterium]
MKKSIDILVAGEINPDLILSGVVEPAFGQVEKLVDEAVLTIGSSSVIFACGAARLGLRVAFTGLCGDDIFGRFMLEAMQTSGVDISGVMVDKEGKTGLSVIFSQGADRAILTYLGLIPALKAEEISDHLICRARHLHVASYFLQTSLQQGLLSLFRRAHKLGLTTSLDTNYDPSEKWAGFDELLTETDIFLPNRTEALAITGVEDVELAAKQLAEKCGSVAVKMGGQGGLACKGGMICYAPTLSVQVVDTVGAGDSFDAGFLYGCLHDWLLEKSLRLACVCGALSTTRAGGTQGQPTLAEAMNYVP